MFIEGHLHESAGATVAALPFWRERSLTLKSICRRGTSFFRQEVRAELRAVAALNNVELITALISFNWQLALVGRQLRILNGVVSLLTTEVHNKALAAYLSEQSSASGNLQMTTASLEVLACIAFRQPVSQAEIDRLFHADKRGLVVKLRDLKLVEEFAGADGRLRFATTQAFLQRFGLTSLQELTAASLSDKQTPTHNL
ncbi:MAG TPA: SMC-Scp complex subunit ScpB [Terrimicrobiaceae bacterium]